MSKQSEAKSKQGYVPKAVPQTCMNCDYFKKDKVLVCSLGASNYYEDKNLRCTLGGFTVKKMGTCDEFRGKTDRHEEIKPMGDVIP